MRNVAVWIACLAMLLASLAPSISHALSAREPAKFFHAEICSATGLPHDSVPDASPRDSSSSGTHAAHADECPYCRLQSELPALPPSAGAALFIRHSRQFFPPLFYQAIRPLFAWTSAQPRAPPLF